MTTSSSQDLMVGSSSTTTESISSAYREPATTSGTMVTTTTTPAPPSNGTEAAQRSASDLTYIYSSQPQQQQAQSSGSSYYSNYLVQPQQPQTVDAPQVAPIIDTTSGQTPEMVVDRTPVNEPQAPQPQPQYDYSQAQSVASFQPAPAPSQRQPPTYYSNNNYAYDTSTYNSAASAFRAQAPVVRQLQPSPVVRQEHHYHYYNSQQQSTAPPERQLQQQQQQQPQVIRELQPIMISQSAASTTLAPAAQIIREIVREVPMQTVQPSLVQMQPTRVVLQQPPIQILMAPSPPPLPILPPIVRDTPAFDMYEPPAKRLMRQLSNSMPQMAIRMPSQFRVQVPAIQLPAPLRAAATVGSLAPVTRQTGSFIIPPMPKKTTTLLTETQAMPTHTTIMQTTQFTPATRTTVYTTDHQLGGGGGGERASGYRKRRKRRR